MNPFLDILMRVTLPIVALIAIGRLLQPRLSSTSRASTGCGLRHALLPDASPVQRCATDHRGLAHGLVLPHPVPVAARRRDGRRRCSFGSMRLSGKSLALGTVYANYGFFGVALVQLAFPAEFICSSRSSRASSPS